MERFKGGNTNHDIKALAEEYFQQLLINLHMPEELCDGSQEDKAIKQRRKEQYEYLVTIGDKLPPTVKDAMTLKMIHIRDSEFQKQLENSSQKVIELGIEALSNQLLTILETEGKLPTTIMYADTSGRALAYATEPLLRSLYTALGEPMPTQNFIKTTRNQELKLEAWQKTAAEEKRIADTLFQEASQKREALLRAYRTSKNEKLSEEIHVLTKYTDKLRQEKDQKRELYKQALAYNPVTFEQATNALLEERIHDIVKNNPGPYLIIEDIIAKGDTVIQINTALATLGIDTQTYFFSFMDIEAHTFKTTRTELENRMAIGVSPDTLPETIKKDPQYSCEIWYTGFDYRNGDTEKTLGVTKAALLTKLSERSPERDPKAMMALRKRYRSWGKEAVRKLGL